ncbi:RNA polymerase sigma-70 factor [Pseudoflavitalea sp. X16]|uniref:RNA polymerase sigma-70 factor n=1 Tax=Paraflavitalea devenefica TaxID=2716334 RepID=UPI00142008B8|nr:RNA polymerase sigma-70 factor [Paraflavitalea devenefica]NII28482.1 RNA polymerase sigma-70 factor [Paraflavitalea devenefica]
MPSDPLHNEQELLQGLQAGEERAFAAIYERYAPALIDYTAARLTSLEEARDIIHDLFVYLWEERAHINIAHSLQAFLFAAVRYRIIDHIRRRITRREYADKVQALQTAIISEMEYALDVKDLQLVIENAVRELPPRVQQVYRLSRDQHRSVTEIAKELGVSPQTVKNQLTTALSHLRSVLHHLPSFLWWF